MIKNESPNQRPVIVAALIASLFMLVSSATYRVLAARLAAPVTTTPIRPETLQQLSLQLGDWEGQEVPLDEAIVRATDTDAHISRRYARKNSLESVSLYIASGVRARDLMPHRPEVCYVGAGWTLTDRQFLELHLSNGTKLPCNILQFSRGALSTERVSVLNYYLVDGQYCHDISLLRSKAWRGSGFVDYVAQVQISASVSALQTGHSIKTIVHDFAVQSAIPIADLFGSSGEDRHPDEDHYNVTKLHKETESG